jgi:hypothetical protein
MRKLTWLDSFVLYTIINFGRLWNIIGVALKMNNYRITE